MRLKPSLTRLSLLVGALFSAAVHSADLVQVYREALVNDPLYAAARATAEAGREKLPQGLSGLLPTLGASANTVWNDNTYHPDGAPSSSKGYNSNGYMLTLSQPVFRWQNWVQYKQGEMQAALADVDENTHLHLSFDMDGLDPTIAPGVGTPVRGGPTYRETQLFMEMLADSGALGSVDIMELNPALDLRNQTAELAVDLLESLFGKSTLMRA